MDKSVCPCLPGTHIRMKIIVYRLFTFAACIIAAISGALFLEVLLDLSGLEQIKHAVGVAGVILISLSIIYSLRKKSILFKAGSIRRWLVAHEWFAVVGAGLVFVHGGFHGHALVPLLATGVMFIAVVSGLTGRYLYLHVSRELASRKKELEEQGLTREETDNALLMLIVTNKIMRHWRTIHIPIVFILALTVVYHIVSALYYDGFLH